MSKFKVGDLVYIRKESQYYSKLPQNPIGVIGRIVNMRSLKFDLPITVHWGYTKEEDPILNWYNEKDLGLAILDSKLNRALYPEYKAVDGYLIE